MLLIASINCPIQRIWIGACDKKTNKLENGIVFCITLFRKYILGYPRSAERSCGK